LKKTLSKDKNLAKEKEYIILIHELNITIRLVVHYKFLLSYLRMH